MSRFAPSWNPSARARRQRGFTMVELIMVIVIMGVIGAAMTAFLRPALDAYFDGRLRADHADQADTALRRMLRDVRRAVPNSLRVPSAQCFELVPTTSGGRYRVAPDVSNDTPQGCASGSSNNCSAWIDPGNAAGGATVFDALTPLSSTPVVGDWVVINNQNSNDVYDGFNRSAITAVNPAPKSTQGVHRISMSALQVSPGYDGGRFQVVSKDEQSVFYICSGADGSVDASGNGKGTLYRLKRNFTGTYPSSCPSTAGAKVLATRVKSCAFVYDPNQGATQQSGFLWMELKLSSNNESSTLAVGAHVLNVP
jgi:MSHA biogenesis protein MshO